MDLSRFTSAQLHIMHQAASDDARRAITLAENKSIEMMELSASCDGEGYAAAHAEFAVLMTQADDHRAYSRQVYNEIARRVNMTAMPVLPDVPAPLAANDLAHVPMVCTACRKPVHESIAAKGWVHDLRSDSRGCNTPAIKAMVAEGNERVPRDA